MQVYTSKHLQNNTKAIYTITIPNFGKIGEKIVLQGEIKYNSSNTLFISDEGLEFKIVHPSSNSNYYDSNKNRLYFIGYTGKDNNDDSDLDLPILNPQIIHYPEGQEDLNDI